MPIRLNIEAETVEEFDTLLARFSPSHDPVMPEVRAAAESAPTTEPAKPAARGRGKKTEAAAPTQNPDGTPIPPTSDPVPQPTPGGTDAPPAESIPPNQPPAGTPAGQADPFAQQPETVAATPAATSPADTAAADAGEVTVQNLKDKMAELLKAKSAAFAMETLFNATGCKSLTSGSPNVVEKAKEDPGIMRRAFDALHAGIAA